MKRILLPLAAIAALALTASALAGPIHAQKIKLSSTTGLGKILENRSGFTVFEFTKDSRKKDRCVAINGCTAVWPPLTTHGKPLAGPGVKASRLGTITLPNGDKQVTYAGRPLYKYSGALGPGDTSYVGTPQFGGTWYAVNAAGHHINASGHQVK